MIIDQVYIESLERTILEIIVNNLRAHTVTLPEVTSISQFVLSRIDGVTDQIVLEKALTDLSEQFPSMTQLKHREVGEMQHNKDIDTAHRAFELAKEGKIEEAIALTKGEQQ